MKYINYKIAFKAEAEKRGYSSEDISVMLEYARTLLDQNLPVIFDPRHISNLLGYDLSFIMSITNSTFTHYKRYEIAKKNGGVRIIHEPLPSLKEMQTWILKYILTPTSKHNVSIVAKAYMPKMNLKENAKFHRGQKKLLTIDLVDFFGSINFYQVYAIYRKFGYTKAVSTILSNLSILSNSLPQGAPTSPMLSNLVFKYYDDKIFEFCVKKNIRYTRYADDLAFSGDFNVGEVISFLKILFRNTSFKINEKKTKVASQGSRQEVTGIVVNKKLQVSRDYRKEIRQNIYYMIKFGIEKHTQRLGWNKTQIQYLYYLMGKVNYVLMVNKDDKEAQNQYMYLKDLLKTVMN